MTLTNVRVIGGPLSGATLGLSEPLPGLLLAEELQDLVEALPALRASLVGGEYELRPPGMVIIEGADRPEPVFVWRDVVQTGNQ